MKLSPLVLFVSSVFVYAIDPKAERADNLGDLAHPFDLPDQGPPLVLGPETTFVDIRAVLVVPPVYDIRYPVSIYNDVLEMRNALQRKETDYTWFNVRIQELLFDRLMVYDPAIKPHVVKASDLALRETYDLLYNKIFDNPAMNAELRSTLQRITQNIIDMRTPFIQMLQKSQANPNTADMAVLMGHIVSMEGIPAVQNSQAPEAC